ncbi:MAG: hypothetical protein Q8936_01815 [Bacillota bacterium]|nr:hypothetical protein [Bacillota bacterium]
MEYCKECGTTAGIEEHHIVYRSQASYMVGARINIKYLCGEHHRGNASPHRDRKIDLKYKKELQKKLFELFNKEYYHKSEIAELLGINHNQVDKLTKTLTWCKEGYERIDIVRSCMGGMLYAD